MTVFIEIALLLSEAPTNLVYHLVALLALELTLSIAWSYWRRTSQAGSERLVLATVLALGLRVVLGVIAVLVSLSLADSQLLPPLDRAIALATMLLLGWSLLSQPPSRILDGLLMLSGLALLVGTVLTVIIWLQIATGADYNNTPDDLGWQVVYMLTAIALMLLFLFRRPADWGLALGIYGLWLGAAAAHLVLSFTNTPITGNFDGLRRFTEIAILPIYTGLIYRHTLRNAAPIIHVTPPAPVIAPPPPPPPPRTALASDAASALADIGVQATPADTANAITQAIGRTLLADVTLLWIAPAANELICAGGYDLIRETSLESFSIGVEHLPSLSAAFIRGRPVHLQTDYHTNELNRLAEHIQITQIGPAFMIPIFHDGDIQGGVMVLSPHAQRGWSNEAQKTLAALARPIAAALYNIQNQVLLHELEDHAQAIEEALRTAQTQSAHAQQQIESLTVQLEQRQASGNQITAEELAQLKAEIDAIRNERNNLQTHLNQTTDQQAALDALHAQVQALHIERNALAKSNQRLAEQNSLTALDLEQAQETWQQEHQTLIDKLASATNQLEMLQMQQAHTNIENDDTERDHSATINVAQELRQPMSSVIRYTDMMLSESIGIVDEAQHKFLKRIKANVARMSILLDELLDATTRPAQPDNAAIENVDVLDVLDNALTVSSKQFRDKDITLRMDIPDDLPSMSADPDALYQVIYQLLSNAFTATHRNGEVAVQAQVNHSNDETEDKYILITIRDSGDGIAIEDQPRVFNRIYRTANPNIRGLGDSGVGLSEAKTLVEALKGRMWLESTLEVGTTFNILLPVQDNSPAFPQR